jgi:hypothetical protein
MRKQELIVGLVVALISGLAIVVVLSGGNLSLHRPIEGMQAEIPVIPSPVSPTRTALPVSMSTVIPSPLPLVADSKKREDLDDVVLLYDPTRHSAFDINFCTIAKYYGLLCKKVPLNAGDITDETLRDPHGDYYRLVGISATNLLRTHPPLSENELMALKSAVSGGLNLLISEVDSGLDPALLSRLTEGTVYRITQPQDSKRDWLVSSALPEITREFSGQTITSDSRVPQRDFALMVQEPATTLISSKDDYGTKYPIFIRWHNGGGSVFVNSGEKLNDLDKIPLREMYYDVAHFSNIVPTMLALRYTAGEEAWHNEHNYADLIIDDPTLTEPFNKLSYPALLREMEVHNFHTTIALPPVNWQKFNLNVVKLFQLHPDRYSIVQHGNNHDGYEFYKYSLAENDPKDDPNFRARPLPEQEENILEGLRRLKRMSEVLEIPFDQIMVFPYGICPEPTLVLLKKYNYLATVNSQDLPLDASPPATWDYGMYPAEMHWGNLATLTRRRAGTYQPFQPDIQLFIFDLFIDKPALFTSHAYENELFADGNDAFDAVAEQVNRLAGSPEWLSLGDILKHLYLEKQNDDGSMDLKIYGNDLIVKNESDLERVYHFGKEENLNVPILMLTVNEKEFPYYVEMGLLKLDVRVPANTSMEIQIQYAD